ncbi:type 1 glutamine amidotransferase [Halobacterium noricense]|uniref:type 1 glutamine amidotransferase n=1 Tax=Halobacterium noricense TaxID=223182 RepID=UPI001E5BF2E8|nr:type 1 glutamine amidotransferase [Halobacterium noricense]UHH25401.1 type 1 glutamine amidotransferase [Halobacterium noricense]
MNRPRVALLNAAHDPTDTTRNFRRELDAELVEFHAADGDLPDSHDYDGVPGSDATGGSSNERCEFDGVVVTGSRSSVYWDEDWIDPLVAYVADCHDAGVPVLGVCFGHQVVAAALGGRVDDMGEYEIGYRRVERVADDPLFDGIDETFTAFTTHSDAVVDLPPGAQLLAENDYGVHAFRLGESVGVQFHPEYDTETAADVTTRKDDLGDERKQDVLDGITPENYAAACEAKQLFANFTQSLVRPKAAD